MLAFCNPLLDATINVDGEYLKKWNLRVDDAILADSSYQPLIDEVCNSKETIITQGGAMQNTLVMAQWMLQKPGQTTMVGAVGPDQGKQMLLEKMEERGVRCLYQEIPGNRTGCCAVLVVGSDRSLVASVAASGCFDYERWDTPEVLEAISKAKIVFFSTFFIRSSDKTTLAICNECLARKIPIAIGLSSPTAIDSEIWSTLKEVLRNASIIVGNTTEGYTLGKKLGLVDPKLGEGDIDYLKLAKDLATHGNPVIKRQVVITMGPEPTVFCETDGEAFAHPIIPIPADKIVDTNGAGDSYIGGYLAYYIQGKDVRKCLDAGAYSAYINLQQRGCTVPDHKPAFE